MNEADIRRALHDTVITQLFYADPITRVVDEFVIEHGKHRVDVAAINGEIHGFEIKSVNDNLDRLPEQQHGYNKVFDRMTLVVDERHVEKAVQIVPRWWGLVSVSLRDGEPTLDEIWSPRKNFDQCPLALAQLLWREEAIAVLQEHHLVFGMRSQTRKKLWKKMATEIPIEKLQESVSRTLKYRRDWRAYKYSEDRQFDTVSK